MFVVAAPQDADQVRNQSVPLTGLANQGGGYPSAAVTSEAIAPTHSVRAQLRAMPSRPTLAKAHLETLRQIIPFLKETNPQLVDSAADATAVMLLEQFLLVRLLMEKGWISAPSGLWQEILPLHVEANPASSTFYQQFIAPSIQVLMRDALLEEWPSVPATVASETAVTELSASVTEPTTPTTGDELIVSNVVSQRIVEALILPYSFVVATTFQTEDSHTVDANVLGQLVLAAQAELTATNTSGIAIPALVSSAEQARPAGMLTGQAGGSTSLLMRRGTARLTMPSKAAPPRKFSAPPRVLRWACQSVLSQYLLGKLVESTQLAEAELQARLDEFFALPTAAQLSDQQIAAMYNLFLRAEAQRMSRALLACRICDPAVGSGTLLACMLEELAQALAKLDVQLYGREIVMQHNYAFRLKRKLISECLFGVDTDATRVRLAQQRLWLMLVDAEQSQPDSSLSITMREATVVPGLRTHLVVGDSLLGCRAYDDEDDVSFKWRRAFPEIFVRRGGFDILLSNAPLQPATRASWNETEGQPAWEMLCALFPQLKRAKNTLAAFFDLPRLIGSPTGIACQIVPRALTMAEGWTATRAGLRLNYNLVRAVDMSETLRDARLDQEVLLYSRFTLPTSTETNLLLDTISLPLLPALAGAEAEATTNTEVAGGAIGQTATPVVAASSAIVKQPRHLSAVGQELVERFTRLRTLGEFATIKEGQHWQRRRSKGAEEKPSRIAVPVIKGNNLRQFRITDELPRLEPPAYIQRIVEELRQPKLLCAQNLTYLKKPAETLVLLCAIDRKGVVALDNVHQVFLQPDCPYSLEFLCGLLNSSLARWFFHAVVFDRAARTVACSPSEIARFPLPRPAQTYVPTVEKLVRKLFKHDHARKYFLSGQQPDYDTLDELIGEMYGLTADERAEVFAEND